jgi:hypothetical protein
LSIVVIGHADESKAVKLKLGVEELVFFDFSERGVFTPKDMNA